MSPCLAIWRVSMSDVRLASWMRLVHALPMPVSAHAQGQKHQAPSVYLCIAEPAPYGAAEHLWHSVSCQAVCRAGCTCKLPVQDHASRDHIMTHIHPWSRQKFSEMSACLMFLPKPCWYAWDRAWCCLQATLRALWPPKYC